MELFLFGEGDIPSDHVGVSVHWNVRCRGVIEGTGVTVGRPEKLVEPVLQRVILGAVAKVPETSHFVQVNRLCWNRMTGFKRVLQGTSLAESPRCTNDFKESPKLAGTRYMSV